MLDCEEFVRCLRAVPSTAASLRAERKKISKQVAVMQRSDLLGLAHYLINAGIARFVAYELVLNHAAAIESITESEVEKLGDGMTHWSDVDSFSCLVAGPAWRLDRIKNKLVQKWTRSDDWCWRRASLVSTVPLNSKAQGGVGDTDRTLKICTLLLADRDDLVIKAMSWALRELSKRDPDNVRKFLREHHSELASRVGREVGNKLATGLKNPRHGSIR